MLPYDDRQSFRTKTVPKTTGRRSPPILRDEALDDLHRALYGSVHPAGSIRAPSYEDDEDLVLGDEPSESPQGWLEDNALTAAVAVVGAFALFAWLKKTKSPPLVGPSDVPLPFVPTTTPPSTP